MAAVPTHPGRVEERLGVFEVEVASPSRRLSGGRRRPPRRAREALPSSFFDEIFDSYDLKRLGSFSDFLNIGKGLRDADCRWHGSNNGGDLSPQCDPYLLAFAGALDKFGELLLGFDQTHGVHADPLSIHRPISVNHLFRRLRRERGGPRDSRQDAIATRT